jgi:hypothetical protein
MCLFVYFDAKPGGGEDGFSSRAEQLVCPHGRPVFHKRSMAGFREVDELVEQQKSPGRRKARRLRRAAMIRSTPACFSAMR